MSVPLNHNPAAIRAKRALVFYFEMLMRNSGVYFDNDQQLKIEQIIDDILTASADGIAAASEYHYQQEHGERSTIAMLQTEYYKEKR